MGVKALRKIQLGKETTPGSAVAATTIWRGEGVLKDEREPQAVKEDVGLFEATNRSFIPKLGATLAMDDTPATFEQLPYILAASVENVVTGTQDGTGSGYIYQYDVPTTSANMVKTFTIEAGDDQRVDEMEYSYVESFTLKGAKGEAVMVSATWRGRQAQDAEFTGSLSLPTVEEILFQKGKLYIDASGGTIGTTQKTNCFLGFSLEVPSGWKALMTGDGNLYFSTIVYVGHKEDAITGELVLEHDATAEAEITAARNESVRLVRMKFEGSNLATPGTTYSKKTLIIDMAIQYTGVPELDDEDGNNIVTLPFRVLYSDVDGLAAQFVVVNELTSLP
jgi:hypothetical protein